MIEKSNENNTGIDMSKIPENIIFWNDHLNYQENSTIDEQISSKEKDKEKENNQKVFTREEKVQNIIEEEESISHWIIYQRNARRRYRQLRHMVMMQSIEKYLKLYDIDSPDLIHLIQQHIQSIKMNYYFPTKLSKDYG